VTDTLNALYLETRKTQSAVYLDGKNRAVLHSLRPHGHSTQKPGHCPPAFIRSPTFSHFIAGPLGLREVYRFQNGRRLKVRIWLPSITTINAVARHMLFLLDLDYFMTMIS
jgi:hypothetical protein